MFNSVILMFSQYGQNRKISNIFSLVWVLHVIASALFNFNLTFSLVNISVFLFVTGVIYCISKNCPNVNTILSIGSILIYSLFVDIICYYVLPSWINGQPLIQYIINGLLFNLKYIFSNAAVFWAVILCSKIFEKNKIKNLRTKQIAKCH